MDFLGNVTGPQWAAIAAFVALFGQNGLIWLSAKMERKSLGRGLGRVEKLAADTNEQVRTHGETLADHGARISNVEKRVDRIENKGAA